MNDQTAPLPTSSSTASGTSSHTNSNPSTSIDSSSSQPSSSVPSGDTAISSSAPSPSQKQHGWILHFDDPMAAEDEPPPPVFTFPRKSSTASSQKSKTTIRSTVSKLEPKQEPHQQHKLEPEPKPKPQLQPQFQPIRETEPIPHTQSVLSTQTQSDENDNIHHASSISPAAPLPHFSPDITSHASPSVYHESSSEFVQSHPPEVARIPASQQSEAQLQAHHDHLNPSKPFANQENDNNANMALEQQPRNGREDNSYHHVNQNLNPPLKADGTPQVDDLYSAHQSGEHHQHPHREQEHIDMNRNVNDDLCDNDARRAQTDQPNQNAYNDESAGSESSSPNQPPQPAHQFVSDSDNTALRLNGSTSLPSSTVPSPSGAPALIPASSDFMQDLSIDTLAQLHGHQAWTPFIKRRQENRPNESPTVGRYDNELNTPRGRLVPRELDLDISSITPMKVTPHRNHTRHPSVPTIVESRLQPLSTDHPPSSSSSSPSSSSSSPAPLDTSHYGPFTIPSEAECEAFFKRRGIDKAAMLEFIHMEEERTKEKEKERKERQEKEHEDEYLNHSIDLNHDSHFRSPDPDRDFQDHHLPVQPRLEFDSPFGSPLPMDKYDTGKSSLTGDIGLPADQYFSLTPIHKPQTQSTPRHNPTNEMVSIHPQSDDMSFKTPIALRTRATQQQQHPTSILKQSKNNFDGGHRSHAAQSSPALYFTPGTVRPSLPPTDNHPFQVALLSPIHPHTHPTLPKATHEPDPHPNEPSRDQRIPTQQSTNKFVRFDVPSSHETTLNSSTPTMNGSMMSHIESMQELSVFDITAAEMSRINEKMFGRNGINLAPSTQSFQPFNPHLTLGEAFTIGTMERASHTAVSLVDTPQHSLTNQSHANIDACIMHDGNSMSSFFVPIEPLDDTIHAHSTKPHLHSFQTDDGDVASSIKFEIVVDGPAEAADSTKTSSINPVRIESSPTTFPESSFHSSDDDPSHDTSSTIPHSSSPSPSTPSLLCVPASGRRRSSSQSTPIPHRVSIKRAHTSSARTLRTRERFHRKYRDEWSGRMKKVKSLRIFPSAKEAELNRTLTFDSSTSLKEDDAHSFNPANPTKLGHHSGPNTFPLQPLSSTGAINSLHASFLSPLSSPSSSLYRKHIDFSDQRLRADELEGSLHIGHAHRSFNNNNYDDESIGGINLSHTFEQMSLVGQSPMRAMKESPMPSNNHDSFTVRHTSSPSPVMPSFHLSPIQSQPTLPNGSSRAGSKQSNIVANELHTSSIEQHFYQQQQPHHSSHQYHKQDRSRPIDSHYSHPDGDSQSLIDDAHPSLSRPTLYQQHRVQTKLHAHFHPHSVASIQARAESRATKPTLSNVDVPSSSAAYFLGTEPSRIFSPPSSSASTSNARPFDFSSHMTMQPQSQSQPQSQFHPLPSSIVSPTNVASPLATTILTTPQPAFLPIQMFMCIGQPTGAVSPTPSIPMADSISMPMPMQLPFSMPTSPPMANQWNSRDDTKTTEIRASIPQPHTQAQALTFTSPMSIQQPLSARIFSTPPLAFMNHPTHSSMSLPVPMSMPMPMPMIPAPMSIPLHHPISQPSLISPVMTPLATTASIAHPLASGRIISSPLGSVSSLAPSPSMEAARQRLCRTMYSPNGGVPARSHNSTRDLTTNYSPMKPSFVR